MTLRNSSNNPLNGDISLPYFTVAYESNFNVIACQGLLQ